MKRRWNFLNNAEDVAVKTVENEKLERQLLPRLQFMGFLLLVFCACTLMYIFTQEESAFILPDEPLSPAEIEFSATLGFPETENFSMEDPLSVNAFIIASSFFLVGAVCLYFVWKKKRDT